MRNHSNGIRMLTLLAGLTVVASTALADPGDAVPPVEVFVMPGTYQVGNLKSTLATPAVDEVVRIGPKKVLIVTCLSTRPGKVVQLERELTARFKGEVQIMTLANGRCLDA